MTAPSAAAAEHGNDPTNSNSLSSSSTASTSFEQQSTTASLLSNGSSSSSSSPLTLMDRLEFVFIPNATPHQPQELWWPAFVFPNYSQLNHDMSISTMANPQKALLFLELLAVIKQQQQPLATQESVAYLIGTTLPLARRTLYQPKRLDFWPHAGQVAAMCCDYPGWQDACLMAMDLGEQPIPSTSQVTTMTTTTATMPNNFHETVKVSASMPLSSTTIATTTGAEHESNKPAARVPSLEASAAVAAVAALTETRERPESNNNKDQSTRTIDATDTVPEDERKPAARVSPLKAAAAATSAAWKETTQMECTTSNKMEELVATSKAISQTLAQKPEAATTVKSNAAGPPAISETAAPMQCEPATAQAVTASSSTNPSTEAAAATPMVAGPFDDDDGFKMDKVEDESTTDNAPSPAQINDESTTSPATPDTTSESPRPAATAAATVPQGHAKPSTMKRVPKTPAMTRSQAAMTLKSTARTNNKKRKAGAALYPTSSAKRKSQIKSPRRLLGLVTPPDSDRKERVPTFEEIKPILEKAECRFGSSMFALPKRDPEQCPAAVCGKDYFLTRNEFRANLCQFGIDEDLMWDEKERDKLCIWIRYHIVTSLKEGDKVPILEGLNDKEAWVLLQLLGFSFASGGYIMPKVDRKNVCEIPGPRQNKFRDRVGEDGLYAHLARFGLPDDVSALTSHQLLALELYLATGKHPYAFKRLQDDSLEFLRGSTHGVAKAPAKLSPATKASAQKGRSLDGASAKRALLSKKTPKTAESNRSETCPPSSAARRLLPSPPDQDLIQVHPNNDQPNEPHLSSDDDVATAPPSTEAQRLALSPDPDGMKVPTFDDVRGLLEYGGFVFRESLYARPGMDPIKNKKAEKGKDYFDSEVDFRQHLCAYGIGVPESRWKADDAETLEDWVRLANATALVGYSTIPECKELSSAQASALLKRIGYGFLTGEFCYIPPGIDRTSEKITETGPCQNRFKDFAHKDGLFNHLARFGLQGDTGKLSAVELLSLQLFIATCHVESVFAKKVDEQAILPAFRAASIQASNRLSIVIGRMKPGGKVASNKKLTGGVRVGASDGASGNEANASSGLEGSPFDNDAVADCQRPTHGWGKSRTVGRNIMPQLNSCTLNGMTVGAKLSACIDALQGSYKLESLSILPKSPFHNHVSEIETFVRTFTNYSKAKPAQSSLYVCGSPGVGKTCSVLWCCSKETEGVQGKKNIDCPLVCHLNLNHMQPDSNGMSALLEAMAETLGTTSNKVLKIIDVNAKNSRKLILVLDEIDLLVGTDKGARSSSREKILENISKWIDNPNLGIALIGISNSVANPRYQRLNSICKFHKKITFGPYSKQDLVNLVQDRIGKNVVDERALEFAAAKVAVTTGDARQMLALTAGAVKKCLESLSEKDGDTPYDDGAPTVKLGNMMQTNRESIKQYADIVDGLPEMAKSVLCVAVTLAQKQSEPSAFTLGSLRRHCLDCLQWGDEGFSIEAFREFIELLLDAGLLIIKGAESDAFMRADVGQLHSIPFHLSLQLQDVQSVLETNLDERDFYRGIMNRARDLAARL